MSIRFLSAAFLLVACSATAAQEAPPADFALETLLLKNGAELRGLILDDKGGRWEFAQIERPPGKPMHAVVKVVEARTVLRQSRLSAEKKKQALEAFQRFRLRAAIEALRMDEIALATVSVDSEQGRFYDGRWFRVFSTADDDTTRRVIVRLEQLFTAFRQLLPPRRDAGVQPSVLLCGSRDEYFERLRLWGLDIKNPAFYSSAHHTVVVGSGLDPLAKQLAARRAQEDELQADLDRRDQDLKNALRLLTEELRRKQFSEDEIKSEVTARRSQWENERKALELDLAKVRRRNEAQYVEASRQLFARIAHEAFHAYLETYVYPPEETSVPGWLNEGLAQIFETAQWDGDILRIDAPAPERLKSLRADLASSDSISLARLITSDSKAFLRTHDRAATERLYLYAWGLAWHLVFQEGRLDIGRLENYLETQDREVGPVQRFERFVDQPLAEFEGRWRQAMRDGKGTSP